MKLSEITDIHCVKLYSEYNVEELYCVICDAAVKAKDKFLTCDKCFEDRFIIPLSNSELTACKEKIRHTTYKYTLLYDNTWKDNDELKEKHELEVDERLTND